jgi:hypothetical protein
MDMAWYEWLALLVVLYVGVGGALLTANWITLVIRERMVRGLVGQMMDVIKTDKEFVDIARRLGDVSGDLDEDGGDDDD